VQPSSAWSATILATGKLSPQAFSQIPLGLPGDIHTPTDSSPEAISHVVSSTVKTLNEYLNRHRVFMGLLLRHRSCRGSIVSGAEA
jgi:hypothetical protein